MLTKTLLIFAVLCAAILIGGQPGEIYHRIER